jgi:uncharacterized membrane protein HdeD (DUF308 family)
MFENRRIGTLTAGISLVVFGVLFLLHLFIPAITYSLISSLWPIVLILLGIEMVLAYLMNKEEKMHYDFGSVVLVFLLTFFSVCMAVAQIVLNTRLIKLSF